MIKNIQCLEKKIDKNYIDIILHIDVDNNFLNKYNLDKKENPINAFSVEVTHNTLSRSISCTLCNEGFDTLKILDSENMQQIKTYLQAKYIIPPDIEYYADYDEDTEVYCVFDTITGKAHESYCSLSQAEKRAEERNNLLKESV